MNASVPAVPRFDRARVLVAGDVMLDRFWHGDTERISPEAPVPVVRLADADDVRPGGAANVAANVAALGAGVTLVGVVGEDEEASELARCLDRIGGVEHALVAQPGHRTTTKLRVLSRHQQLIRLDRESARVAGPEPALGAAFEARLGQSDAVVLSDYGKGALGNVGPLIERAVARGLPVLVDPKGRSFERYRGASLITPNWPEFEAVAGPCPDDETLVARAQQLCRALDLGAILVTRGEHGMTLVRPGHPAQHARSRAREVFDVTGAGDTVIATLGAAIAAGAELVDAAELANRAAGLVVAKLGTATVGRAELERAVTGAGEPVHGVVDEPVLLDAVREARAAGETVVMTNGCFDILHAGHARALADARAEGDRLIVAVNDDASVRRLKGADRPVVPLAQRMELLAALRSVDWVIPFGEDTPADLISRVLPDVLAKGGDYRPQEIAGADHVLRNGGRVAIVPYREGWSSSRIIERARRDRTDEAIPR